MNRIKRWAILADVACPMLFGLNRMGDLRDAVAAGGMDCVTRATTDLLGSALPKTDMFADER